MILEDGTKDQLLDCMVEAMTPQVGECWRYCYPMAVDGDWFSGNPFMVNEGMTDAELSKLLRDNVVNGMLERVS